MQAWFISDIHIKDINERNSQKLLRFLLSLKEKYPQATHLYLLGDIFDLWVGDSPIFQSKFQSIVDALVKLKKEGIDVNYFEGNHDVHIRRFWANKGIPVFTSALTVPLGQHLVRMEHGDFINPEDTVYINYRQRTYTALVENLAHIIPGIFWSKAGELASKISRSYSAADRQNKTETLRKLIRQFAEGEAEKSEFSMMITGHMHVRDEHKFRSGGKDKVSINLGSWYEEPMALQLDEASYQWVKV